jgi:hypothetical protein
MLHIVNNCLFRFFLHHSVVVVSKLLSTMAECLDQKKNNAIYQHQVQ